MDLTAAAQSFLPSLQQHQEDAKKQVAQKRFEIEEAKFEDETYLRNYFKEMRQQIEKDRNNISMYFPIKINAGDSKRSPNHLFDEFSKGPRQNPNSGLMSSD